ncbi:MAG: hypothetical protein JOY53_14075 [Acidobacteriaceae bacterium]|nr:hypothetical protein [Acidobacteriaceae bacterium]
MNDVPAFPTSEARWQALEAVLGSSSFSKNPRLSALLEYLCARSLRGETAAIKEYSIATDVFGRSPDFDQSTDAIVRVEMHRLRRKLKEFYLGEGADQPLEIVIQSGHYQPEFVVREKPNGHHAANGNGSPPDSAALWKQLDTPIQHTPPKLTSRVSAMRLWAVGASGALVLLFGFLFANGSFRRSSRASSPPFVAAAATRAIAGAQNQAVRILCGQVHMGYRDRDGNEWGADSFYSGGTALDVPAQPIYRTRNPHLFEAMRAGEFSYKIPLRPGVYELRLYFADTSYVPGPAMEGGESVRIFNVSLNGRPILPQFDIISDAGANTADVRVFKDVSPEKDGYLHLDWTKAANSPLVNAIEVVPGTPHRLLPIRIVTQDSTFFDHSGTLWAPDDYFLGGRTIARFGSVSGSEDPQLYERERYGNFSYAIPVAQGRYAVRLFFAETYFGASGADRGGAGSRLFDVFCNGTALIRNFDMLGEAGRGRQITKTFHGLEPNAQGKLLLSFVPIVNYANLSAIEVIDES